MGSIVRTASLQVRRLLGNPQRTLAKCHRIAGRSTLGKQADSHFVKFSDVSVGLGIPVLGFIVKTHKILVVEDSEPFRRLIVLMVQQNHEYQVVAEATDGLEAIRRAEELAPDLVLMDIGLPKMNGIESARLIRQKAPKCKIVFLTQQSDVYAVQDAIELGALGYVHKSHTANDLLPALEAALTGRQFVSENLNVPLFDIFAGTADKSARWVETVAGLANARDRMLAIAAQTPGRYFVFSRRDHSILAQTETREKPAPLQKSESGVA